MYSLIKLTTGGNHGHQIKDLLGALTISKFFKLTYLYQPNPYLDFTGLKHVCDLYQPNLLANKKPVSFNKERWEGYDGIRPFFLEHLKLLFPKKRRYYVFKNAHRLHPFQLIRWYKKGYIKRNIYRELLEELDLGFGLENPKKPTYFHKGKYNVAIHISRGGDFDKEKFPLHFRNSKAVRYMFPLSYFTNIQKQIEDELGKENVQFHVFTEALNSEEIVGTFGNIANTTLHIGDNRNEIGQTKVVDIFNAFVKADVMVSCNSSFSAVATYFRCQRPTVYHQHKHLNNLNWPWYFSTSETGAFNAANLKPAIEGSLNW